MAGKLPRKDTQLHERVGAAYWEALDAATSAADGEARLRRLVTDLERQYPSAAACLAEDLPALCVHLEYPLRLRKRLRSTNLLERSLEEVKRRTKVIGRFPGETSCLSLCWAVLDLFIASARPVHRQCSRTRPDRAGAPSAGADARRACGREAGDADCIERCAARTTATKPPSMG